MKLKLFIIIILTLTNLKLLSEQNNLGIYAGIEFKPAFVSDEISFFSGARAGVIFNQNIGLGIGLYSMTFNNYKPNFFDEKIQSQPFLEYNYYGLDLEYFLFPQKDFYTSFHLFAGRGRGNLNISEINIEQSLNYEPQYLNVGYFTVLEPGANFYLKLRDYYRIVFGIGYRIALNADLKFTGTTIEMTNSRLSGFYANFSILFGSF